MKQKLLYILTSLVLAGVFSACQSDEPDGGKISVPNDQPKNITIAANETEGQIIVNSDCSISAWVSDSKDGVPSADIEWLTVDRPHKDDGKWYINFNLETNLTGVSRTAYIVVVAEDEKTSFTITQSDEDDLDLPVQINYLYMYKLSMESIFGSSVLTEWDGNRIAYNGNSNLVEQIFGNLGTASLEYEHGQVKLTDTNGVKWLITVEPDGGEDPFTTGLVHHLMLARQIDIIHADGDKTTYALKYENGRMIKCTQYNHGQVYETSEIAWKDGDIQSVTTTYNQSTTVMTPKYSTVENSAHIMEYDTFFWIDLDDAQVLYYCGLLGLPTKHLIESSTAVEYDGGETYNFSSDFQYSFDSQHRPIKVVYREIEEGEGTSSSIIDYSWKNLY